MAIISGFVEAVCTKAAAGLPAEMLCWQWWHSCSAGGGGDGIVWLGIAVVAAAGVPHDDHVVVGFSNDGDGKSIEMETISFIELKIRLDNCAFVDAKNLRHTAMNKRRRNF
ncbi:hypothetical protein Ancab_008916 [Ancistrocladus abbreviatus]